MKTNRFRSLLLALFLFGLGATAARAEDALKSFFADAFEEKLKDNPETATALGRHDYDDRWNNWSQAGRLAVRQHVESRLKQLAALPTGGISAADQLSVRLYRYQAESDLAADDLETHLLRLQQLYGLHVRVYLTIDRMPAHNGKDYQNIIARLKGVPAYVDQNIEILGEAVARGLTQPIVVIDRIIDQLDHQIAQDAQHSALLGAFSRFPTNVSTSEQQSLRAAAQDAYDHGFLPSWKKLRAYIAGPYRAKARPKVGIGSLPGGGAAYAVLIRRLTTTSRSPEEIHKLGLDEVQRIETEMLAVAREIGFSGSLAEFAKALETNGEQHFTSKEEMLVYCRNAAKVIEPELPTLFKRMPLLLYGVRAIPEDREQATASNAQAPAADGSAPGWFNLNTFEPAKQFKYDKEALVLHEAVPGHVFQGAVARSIAGLPEFRKYYGNSAYGEGWALYAESLGRELGVYRSAYSRYGQLASERFRAVRLVVDTGMHAFGWSRDQAVEYFHAHAPEETDAEIDRYISWPAQALAYKLGQLEIRALRSEAESKLGVRFDVREFHDVVLRDGTLPLELLREQVQNYIAATP